MFRKLLQWFRVARRQVANWIRPGGDWHHFIVSYDGKTTADNLRIFLDGKEIVTRPLKTRRKHIRVDPHSVSYWFKKKPV